MLTLQIEGLAHLNRLFKCAIIRRLATFEGNMVEEASFGIPRAFTYGGELFAVAEGEDIAVTILDTHWANCNTGCGGVCAQHRQRIIQGPPDGTSVDLCRHGRLSNRG